MAEAALARRREADGFSHAAKGGRAPRGPPRGRVSRARTPRARAGTAMARAAPARRREADDNGRESRDKSILCPLLDLAVRGRREGAAPPPAGAARHERAQRGRASIERVRRNCNTRGMGPEAEHSGMVSLGGSGCLPKSRVFSMLELCFWP